jgi:DNA modification methylase
MSDATIHQGDVLDVLRGMPDNSFDACVCDPPYGLRLMGHRWDYDVPSAEVWREVLRVLKPGGHLLAFAGTRTQHRMACAIEDGGFEIRDLIGYLYGVGFPKSLDVAAAIDKLDAAEKQHARRLSFTAWVRSTGVTAAQIDAATGTNMGGHYTSAASQPAIMTREHLEACRQLLGDVPAWVERECDVRSVESENFKRREVLGHRKVPVGHSFAGEVYRGAGNTDDKIAPITAPATPEAQRWHGYGTALKPAFEPVTVARKSLAGAVAENVLRWGTGAINVDGCRVGTESTRRDTGSCGIWGRNAGRVLGGSEQGRWPANIIHDGSDEVLAVFPETESGAPGVRRKVQLSNAMAGPMTPPGRREIGYADRSSAARFFYCAKPGKGERGAGNTHPTVKPLALTTYLAKLVLPPAREDGAPRRLLVPFAGSGSEVLGGLAAGWDEVVGIEREPEYVAIAKQRIAARGLTLPGVAVTPAAPAPAVPATVAARVTPVKRPARAAVPGQLMIEGLA